MDTNKDILDAYIYETNTLLEQLETMVLSAEKVDTFSQDDVNEIFRIMHTIKGSSAMMEFDNPATVAHRVEDLFFIIRDKTMDVVPEEDRPALFDLLFQSIDYFRSEVEKIESGETPNDSIDTLLENIKSLMAKIKGEKTDTSKDAPKGAPADASKGAPQAAAQATATNAEFPYSLHELFGEGCGMVNLRSLMLVNSIRDFCPEGDFSFDPADVETNQDTAEQIVEHGFTLFFKDKEQRDNAIQTVTTSGSVRSYQTEDALPKPEPAPAPEAPAQAAEKPAAQPSPKAAPAPQAGTLTPSAQHPKESLISVNLNKLDQLNALVGEIVITESMVTSSPDLKGLNLDQFTKSARQLRKLTDELQDVAMSLRMVPVSGTFQKMNRIVRDMSKKLNKRAKLTLVGEDTEVDKTIVDSIGDPIMHIIRNSMDHGIEDNEEDRIKAGKDPVGEVILSARDTGSEVIIEIQDDGQGVNYEGVLNKAIKNGLASPDMEYSNKEILNFLMLPGFSTNTQVTEFSGRGVGMDVVKRNIEEVGGTIKLESEPGKGMTTILKIPLTMSIMDGMEVSVGDSIFTIPINNIRQSLKVSSQDVELDSAGGEMIKILDNFYPIVRARDVYQLEKGRTEISDGIVMWLESGECSYCLFVDELLGEQQVVVKQLPSYLNSFNIKEYGINGCTLLGDGSISIILDVLNLYKAAQGLL